MKPGSVSGVVVARLDSVRLPGKALIDVGGRRLIDYVLTRVQRVQGIDHLIVATTDRPLDDPLAEHCENQGLRVFRGSVNDVCDRVLGAAESTKAEWIVRINGDSPLADPELIDQGIAARNDDFDLVTNLAPRSFPYGISVEVVKTSALAAAHPRMSESDREHVTAYLYSNHDPSRILNIWSGLRYPDVRMVVDTGEDLAAFKDFIARVGDEATTMDPHRAAALYAELSK